MPNYRGSTGFTKGLLVKSCKQWGKTMHTDLLGFIDSEHVAIFGGSYSGYSALCGVTLTPDFFTCLVDFVGPPSSLITLIKSILFYWILERGMLKARFGDEVEEADMPIEVSPLTHAHKIVKPYARKNLWKFLYPNEGHGFSTPVNRIDVYSKAELFLSEFMGYKS
ncbi:hypothetical protein HDU92_004239 [Lobulomyces angularis]|nr:hypothetical protein HDU92_004239 [Lobulomyces angularis]